jgi:hypothetical protein
MHTTQYRPISGEKAVFERLFVVAGLEGILFDENIGYVLASELSDLVSAMAIEDAKE